MTRDETIMLLGAIRAGYPRFYDGVEDMDAIVDLWAGMFGDYPADLVMEAYRRFLTDDNKGFPPVIGQIMHQINEITQPAADVPSEAEAWEQVKRAVSNGLYNAGREFEKLHPILKRLVGGPDTLYRWALMEEETLDMNIRPMICRSYNQYAEQERADKLLPPSMQANVKALRDAARPALEEPKEEPLRIESREPEHKPTGGDGFERFMAALKGLAGTKSMDADMSDDTRMDDMEARTKLERMAQVLRGGVV